MEVIYKAIDGIEGGIRQSFHVLSPVPLSQHVNVFTNPKILWIFFFKSFIP